MKEGQDKVDNIFKKRLEDPATNVAYNEDDWEALEQMLDKGKKRPFIVYWRPIVSGLAALMLIFIGWWYFKADQATVKPNQQATIKPVQPSDTTGINSADVPVGVPVGKEIALKPDAARKSEKQKYFPGMKTAPVETTVPEKAALEGAPPTGTTPPQQPANANVAAIRKDSTPPPNANLVAVQRDPAAPGKVNGNSDSGQGIQAEPGKAPVKVKANPFNPGRPQYALSVIASSDINGVNSFRQSKVGSNFGAMLSVSVKKWTITTGATYSVKPYATAFANYTKAYQFKQDPTNVTADCRMLDVPLNIGYQVYQKGKNKFALGTGLSSYFMLHERYQYTYSSANANNPAEYTVPSPKNYLLSVVNLNATFEHQVNSKFSLSVQPYMKLPLKAIGYSQVNLHTAGVAVGFNWNINSFTKPK